MNHIKRTAALALTLAIATCSAAPAIAQGYPDAKVCEAMAALAMDGAELGATMDYLDPYIDELNAIAETEDEARLVVGVLVGGYAQGVIGVSPDVVALLSFQTCMSVPA